MWVVYATCVSKNSDVYQDVIYLLWYKVIRWSSHICKISSFVSFYISSPSFFFLPPSLLSYIRTHAQSLTLTFLKLLLMIPPLVSLSHFTNHCSISHHKINCDFINFCILYSVIITHSHKRSRTCSLTTFTDSWQYSIHVPQQCTKYNTHCYKYGTAHYTIKTDTHVHTHTSTSAAKDPL